MRADQVERAAPDTPRSDAVPRRRRPLLASVAVLFAAIVALLGFIAVMADVRRVNNALRQGAVQARHFAERMHGSGVLPLNFEPVIPPELLPKLLEFEGLPTDQAMDLRKADERVMVAWSVPVFRLFGSDGRSVVFFRDGTFEVEWMSLRDFEAASAEQAERVAQLRAS